MTTLLCVATLIAASTQFTVSASAIDGNGKSRPCVSSPPPRGGPAREVLRIAQQAKSGAGPQVRAPAGHRRRPEVVTTALGESMTGVPAEPGHALPGRVRGDRLHGHRPAAAGRRGEGRPRRPRLALAARPPGRRPDHPAHARQLHHGARRLRHRPGLHRARSTPTRSASGRPRNWSASRRPLPLLVRAGHQLELLARQLRPPRRRPGEDHRDPARRPAAAAHHWARSGCATPATASRPTSRRPSCTPSPPNAARTRSPPSGTPRGPPPPARS